MRLSDLISMPLECGGHGRCGKCKVQVSGSLSPVTPEERGLLTQEELNQGYRLACMTQVLGDYEIQSVHPDAFSIQLDFGAETDSAAVTPSSSAPASVGVAVDIGTTTLAAYWYDLSTGRLLEQKALPNPQRLWGADVISRIEQSQKGQLTQLTASLRQGILSLLPSDYSRLVLTGNTTMLYFLCQYAPDALATVPFTMEHSFGIYKNSVLLPPCLSAYMGADIVTAALASGIWRDGQVTVTKPTLLLDAGTNGEMILAANGQLYGCSTAAGPAFEGSHLSCGLPSVSGAICRVRPDFSFDTIGHLPPKGYCGSGILDIVATLLNEGTLDESGFLEDWSHPELPALSQRDIREIQTAKSAIMSGCQILMEEAQVSELDTIYLAGGFGSQLNPTSARRIGLIPPASHVLPLGNAAGHGASMLLLNPSLLEDALALRSHFHLVELAEKPQFSNAFIENMYFPEEDPNA